MSLLKEVVNVNYFYINSSEFVTIGILNLSTKLSLSKEKLKPQLKNFVKFFTIEVVVLYCPNTCSLVSRHERLLFKLVLYI